MTWAAIYANYSSMPRPKRHSSAAVLGHVVQGFREARRVSRTQLAEATGVDSSWIWKLENGLIDPPLHRIHRVAEALGVHVEQIVKAVYPRPRNTKAAA